MPDTWAAEIAAGTEKGRKRAAAWRALQNRGVKRTPSAPNTQIIVPGTFGAQLLAAVESAIGHRVACGECKRFILSVKASSDIDTTVAKLVANLEFSPSVREQHPTRQKQAEWIRGIVESVVLSSSQRKPRSDMRPPDRFQFAANPAWTCGTRHLTYHVWPTKRHDGWRWNFQQLAARRDLFNGRKILGVVTSKDTETAETVIGYAASLGLTFDRVIDLPNNATIREVVTWVPMLQELHPETATQDEVVFSSHAKGTRHDALSETLEAWTRTMYSACLDDWPAVETQLRQYIATGAFKRYNNFNTPGNDCWHYSGTFFWWRLAELAQRNWREVDQRFFGTESWLGRHVKREEAGCLFLDECGDLYQPQYWRDVVQPAWEARVKR